MIVGSENLSALIHSLYCFQDISCDINSPIYAVKSTLGVYKISKFNAKIKHFYKNEINNKKNTKKCVVNLVHIAPLSFLVECVYDIFIRFDHCFLLTVKLKKYLGLNIYPC